LPNKFLAVGQKPKFKKYLSLKDLKNLIEIFDDFGEIIIDDGCRELARLFQRMRERKITLNNGALDHCNPVPIPHRMPS